MKIELTGDYVLIQTEDVAYKSDKGIVGPKGLEKSGIGIKGKIIAPYTHFLNESEVVRYKKGDDVEFIRNRGYQLRQNVYAVEPSQIVLSGDLDAYLETLKNENKDG